MNQITDLVTSKKTKRNILKNILCVGLSWTFLFTAYSSIANLQSSLNSDGGLGTASLSIIYVSLIFSSLFIPTVMLDKFGIKKTIFISQLGYILYILSNIYPKYYTMIPAAVLIGLAAAPLWAAKVFFFSKT
jgi:MFS family permease